MADKRWSVGKEGHALYRDGQLVGMIINSEIANELVTIGNNEAPNDVESIANAIGDEANRVWGQKEKDYPSNVLDNVCMNLRLGHRDMLSEPRGKKRGGEG